MSKERAAQLIDAGVWLKLSGDLEGSRRLFERALKLDPENEKARQLLGAPATEMPSVEGMAAAANPFERVHSSPSVVEQTWGLATGGGPAPSAGSGSMLEGDWGRLAGSSETPTPQVAPSIAPVAPAASVGLPPPPAFGGGASSTQQFALPAEVARAASAPPGPPETLVFALPPEVRKVMGSSAPPLGQADQDDKPLTPEQELRALADQEQTDPRMKVERPKLVLPRRKVPGSAPSGVQPAAPPPVQPSSASSASSTMHFAMPEEVKQALAGASTLPSAGPPTFSSPSGTFAIDEEEEFGRLAEDVEELALVSKSGIRVAPLPRSSPRREGPPTFSPTPLPVPAPEVEINLADDWGGLTEDPARAATERSLVVSTSPERLPPPPAYATSAPQGVSTQQFFMPEEVRHALGSSAGARSGNVVLTGTAPPPEAPLSTPPLFSHGQVVINGDAGPVVPPSATPPMFSDGPPDPLRAFDIDVLPPAPGSPAPRPPDAPGEGAWQWKSGPPTPQGGLPSPRASPALDPLAQSAWDNRTNPGITLKAVVGADRALDLLSADSKSQRDPGRQGKDEISGILRSARDLLDLDDHTGAMELIEKAEKVAPDSPEVRQLRERSERTLLAMFESKLGHLDKVPRILLKEDEIIWLNLDHRAGFVLAQIDGAVTFEDLFAVSGMSRLDTARILAQLVDEGVISRG